MALALLNMSQRLLSSGLPARRNINTTADFATLRIFRQDKDSQPIAKEIVTLESEAHDFIFKNILIRKLASRILIARLLPKCSELTFDKYMLTIEGAFTVHGKLIGFKHRRNCRFHVITRFTEGEQTLAFKSDPNKFPKPFNETMEAFVSSEFKSFQAKPFRGASVSFFKQYI